jgi:DNA-binding NtrC family response regulator
LVPAVGEVDRLVRDLIDALDGALGERDRLRAAQEEAASSGSKKTARIERTAERIEERAPPPTLPSVPGEEVWVPEPGSFDPRAPILPLLELEKKAYLHALDKSNQSVARAAEALGVSKVTFYAKLRSWGMHPRDRFDEEGPTNVRRARMSSVSGHERTNEPFEPPTRTSSTKIRTEK